MINSLLCSADKTSVVLFSAEWAEQCKQVLDVLEDLSKLVGDKLQFITITAEEYPEVAMKHQVGCNSHKLFEILMHSFS